MFFGEFNHQVDGKYRFRMPSAFRDQFNGNYAFRIDEENVVSIYPVETIRQRAEKFLTASPFDRQVNKLASAYLSSFYLTGEDERGRIVIPKEIRSRVELTGNVVIYAAPDHVEMTSEANYRATKLDLTPEQLLDQLHKYF